MVNENKIVTFNDLKKYTKELGKRITTDTNNLYRHTITLRGGNGLTKVVIDIYNSSVRPLTETEILDFIKDNYSYESESAVGNNYSLIANGLAGETQAVAMNVIGIFYNLTSNCYSLITIGSGTSGGLTFKSYDCSEVTKINEIITKVTAVNTNPNEWQDDDPYTNDPEDTDTLSNVDLENSKVKKITFGNLFTWISNKFASLFDAKADKSTTLSGYGITNAYTKAEIDTDLGTKLTATGTDRGLNIINNKVGISNSITVPTAKRILQATYNEQGQIIDIENEFNWSNNYFNSAENQLFTRKGANDMYVNYLKSTNGTLTKNSVITNDYSHYVKCGNIYQLSIGFQNNSDIAKDAVLYTLPETISNSSIEMYIVISTVAGDTRILQCGGGGNNGNVLKAKSIVPAGYWFGNAIFIKL